MLAAMACLLAAALILVALPAGAGPLETGSEIELFALDDQHGNEHAVDGGVRAILFAQEMAGADLVKEALSESGAELLSEADAVYIANVSGMPTLIRRIFALPKMRRRGYPMLLDTEGTITQDFPGSEGRATLIQLEASKVVGISHYDSADAVRTALRSLRREPPAAE